MEKDFFAGQGERKRITPIQFCSDSTLPAAPGHPRPSDQLGPAPGPGSSGCSLGAAGALETVETGGRGGPAALAGLGFSPLRSVGQSAREG